MLEYTGVGTSRSLLGVIFSPMASNPDQYGSMKHSVSSFRERNAVRTLDILISSCLFDVYDILPSLSENPLRPFYCLPNQGSVHKQALERLFY